MGSDIEECLKKKKGAKGLVLIMTNDYIGCKVHGKPVGVLEACHIDGEKMKETFVDTFEFAYHWEKNSAVDRTKDLLKQVATCNYRSKYQEIKFIVVVFSGHGSEGTLLCNDGEEIEVKNVLERLKPEYMPNASEEIVKLFFFDACRGVREMELSKKKGYQPRPGEYLVAYSTYPGFVSYPRPDGEGSQWMPDVAESLKVERELPVYNAIAKANEKRKWRQAPTIFTTGSCGNIKLHEVILGKQNLSLLV